MYCECIADVRPDGEASQITGGVYMATSHCCDQYNIGPSRVKLATRDSTTRFGSPVLASRTTLNCVRFSEQDRVTHHHALFPPSLAFFVGCSTSWVISSADRFLDSMSVMAADESASAPSVSDLSDCPPSCIFAGFSDFSSTSEFSSFSDRSLSPFSPSSTFPDLAFDFSRSRDAAILGTWLDKESVIC